jgi:hypothetical protein
VADERDYRHVHLLRPDDSRLPCARLLAADREGKEVVAAQEPQAMVSVGLWLVGTYPVTVAALLTGGLTTDNTRLSKVLIAGAGLSVVAGCAGVVLIVAGLIL